MTRLAGILAAVAVLLLLRSGGAQAPSDAGFTSYAKYGTEEEAIARGRQLGLGEATLETPQRLVVNSLAELRFRFRVGPAGMKEGGGLRVATAHGFGWDLWGGTRLQTTDPRAENYLTFRTSTGAKLEWRYPRGDREIFLRYHPWQNINQFTLAGPDLKPGDFIEFTMGDRSGGSPGVRVQMHDETAFAQKFYVDARGDGDYLPLEHNPHLEVAASSAQELKAIAASEWQAGQSGWINVWADDGFGNPAASYSGTVSFEVEGGGAGLPADYAFTASDRGAHRFEDVRFARAGVYRVRVRDRRHNLIAESNPLRVTESAPRLKTYWGDLHTHTMYSDGRGTPTETYDFGKRVSALDFCAVSDHAFTVTEKMWREIIATTDRFNQPGRYVTFLAYEWSGESPVGGDHNVYTTERSMPLIRSLSYYTYENLRMYHGPNDALNQSANHVEQLFRLLGQRFRNENLMVIPHFGGRQGNPSWHNPKLQRLIEIFSDHRRSEDWTSTFLSKGYRIGLMASTDNHTGNAGYGVRREQRADGKEGEAFSHVSPAERGTALVAAIAPDLTRESVFQALYHRRTYATTGRRILLDFAVSGLPMGSEGRVSGAPKMTVTVEGTAPVASVRIVKNGRIIHAVAPGSRSVNLEYVDQGGGYENAYYYVDVVQADGAKAISSPVWIN